jgi:ABC-type glutathione transport system ATPase component
LIDGNVLKTFTLDVSADLEVKGLELEIRNGKIMSVTGGSLEGSGNISVGNVLIWSKDFDSVRLPGTVQLNDGLSLPAL